MITIRHIAIENGITYLEFYINGFTCTGTIDKEVTNNKELINFIKNKFREGGVYLDK